MLFTTIEFFIFLVVVLVSVELLRKQLWQFLFLLGASYFFYWWSGSIYLLLLIFVTIASYLCGAKVYTSNTKKRKRFWLIIGTLIPLGILAYFKYADWGISSLNSLLTSFGVSVTIPLLNVVLPVGISFFTFQALSYIFDIYLGKLEPETKFHKYALFIAFFPALVAGPIVRASEFLPQLKSKIRITSANLQAGVTLILWGLFKKMVIADNIAPIVNFAFQGPANQYSIYIIAAVILFGVQIYCDFSGYAHIAIGCARILGFTIPDNFNLPYLARNPQEFWRKWHMTLSRFIRDYVYIPLGGNRKGHLRTYVNLFASMVICGLWHGAAITFVIWGAYHGLLLLIHRFFVGEKKVGVKSNFLNKSAPGLFIKILITQVFVFFGWLIFRANTVDVLQTCVQKIIFFDWVFPDATKYAVIGALSVLIVLFIALFNKKISSLIKCLLTYDYLGTISSLKPLYWAIYIVVMATVIFCLCAPEAPEFIYFAF